MRCTIGSVLLCVGATMAALQAQDILSGPRDLNRRGEGVNRLERWVDIVPSHQPGIPDRGTRQLESWTAEDLEELAIDLPSLLKLMDEPRGDGSASGSKAAAGTADGDAWCTPGPSWIGFAAWRAPWAVAFRKPHHRPAKTRGSSRRRTVC